MYPYFCFTNYDYVKYKLRELTLNDEGKRNITIYCLCSSRQSSARNPLKSFQSQFHLPLSLFIFFVALVIRAVMLLIYV